MGLTFSKDFIYNSQYLHVKIFELLIQKFLHLTIKSINLEINIGYLCLQAQRQVLNALFRLYSCRLKCSGMVHNITPWISIADIGSQVCLILWRCDIGPSLLFSFGVFKLKISVHWLLYLVCINLFLMTLFLCACHHFIVFLFVCSRSELVLMRIVRASLLNTMKTHLLIRMIQRLFTGSVSFVRQQSSLFRPTAGILLFLRRIRKQCFLFEEADETAIYITH